MSSLVTGYRSGTVGPVSFTVHRGEILGLIGPNGAGKTTILKAVIGTARIFEGRVDRAPGVRVSVQRQQPVRLREMPIVGQELLRLTDALRRPVPAALEPLMHTRIDRLSGGQFQLLQVWACLGSPADLVLLDEPTNNMDPGTIALLADLVVHSNDGRGVVMISHEHGWLERVCTRIVDITA